MRINFFKFKNKYGVKIVTKKCTDYYVLRGRLCYLSDKRADKEFEKRNKMKMLIKLPPPMISFEERLRVEEDQFILEVDRIRPIMKRHYDSFIYSGYHGTNLMQRIENFETRLSRAWFRFTWPINKFFYIKD